MKPLREDLERRRPVWEALSDLFLDNELQDYDHRHIARVLAASGYTNEELELILRHEVGRVVGENLLCVAGVWDLFDPKWLEEEILKNQRGWRRWIPRCSGFGMIRKDWQRVCVLLDELRAERL
jgi:hypothetical protein